MIGSEILLLDKGTDEYLISKPPNPNKTSPKKAGLKQSLPFFIVAGLINKLHFGDCGRRSGRPYF
jgi:hypothetical protein